MCTADNPIFGQKGQMSRSRGPLNVRIGDALLLVTAAETLTAGFHGMTGIFPMQLYSENPCLGFLGFQSV